METLELNPAPIAEDEPTLIQTRGRKILLVDDERINLSILRRMLHPAGYILAEAHSAEAALELYAQFKPDLVLLDVLLPGMNGFEACRELRKHHGANAAPVIFITAKQESADVVEGFGAGGVDYILKPFRQKEVLARIHTHMQIRILMDQQSLLVDELSRANTAKTRFLGMVAHDLRNPLSSIRGLAEFMLDGTVGPLASEQTEMVSLIHQTSQGMVTLVNDLLDLSTIEAGEFKLEKAPVQLAEIVTKAIKVNGMEANRKKTKLVFTESIRAPAIAIDPAKIRQVIDNLLSNAVKYSPPASQVHIALTETTDGSQVIHVRDAGPGIPEAERHRLFTDFGRLSTRPTAGEQSVGLGLAICRKIVEAHHGTIAAQNHPSGGCEFRVTLPRC